MTPITVKSLFSVKKGRMRSVWKSQESERRLRELREGARDRRTTGSSSAPPPLRMSFGTAEPTGMEAGLVSRILGGGGGGAIAAVDVVDGGGGLEELLDRKSVV